MFMLRVELCQCKIATDEIRERKIIESTALQNKSSCVSALTSSLSSVPRKMAKGCRDFQSPAGIEPMSSNSLQLALTTKPQVHVCQLRKTIYQSSCLAPLNGFFCVQNYHYRIAQPEYQGQIRHTRILDCEPSINTCYSIGVIGQRLGRNIFSPLKFAHH